MPEIRLGEQALVEIKQRRPPPFAGGGGDGRHDRGEIFLRQDDAQALELRERHLGVHPVVRDREQLVGAQASDAGSSRTTSFSARFSVGNRSG